MRQGNEEAGAIAAGPIGIHATAMRQAFQGGQRMVDDVVTGHTTKARHKARAAGVVVGMPPVWMPGLICPGSHTLPDHNHV
jgi:hypothetical protein